MLRRHLLKLSAGVPAVFSALSSLGAFGRQDETTRRPIVVSTWDHGQAANEAAWKILVNNGRAVDSAEAGVRVTEADPSVSTVGFGGFPDRDGKVTLDACIQDETGNCGSVAFLQHVKHPVSVARKVMEETPHVMLVGEGALQFALEQGFKKENLLTEKARKAWDAWLEKAEYKPVINIENHDTIGLLALDAQGRMGGACTTSGAAFKMHGRVGDSPLIGAGLFVDGEVGAACATGMGELVIKTVGSHLVVELMYQGHSPRSACEQAVRRIAAKLPDYKDFQVGFLALNRKGQYGAFCIQPGFTYAVRSGELNRLSRSDSLL